MNGSGIIHFRAQILTPDNGVGAYIEFPLNVEEVFNKAGRIKVRCQFDSYEYRGSLVKMGTTCHIVGIRKEILKSIHKKPGDFIEVAMIEDTEERIVFLPEEIQKYFEDHQVMENFRALSFTKQTQIAESIKQAQKIETKTRRLEKILIDLNKLKEL